MKHVFSILGFTALVSACGGQNPVSSSSAISSSSSSQSSTEISQKDISAYFAAQRCGVGFGALGDSEFSPCYRTPGGGAECIRTETGTLTGAVIEPVVWQDTLLPVKNVLHVSGGGLRRERGVTIVTTDGQVFRGDDFIVSPDPVLSSGAVSASGGYFGYCVIVNSKIKKDVLCANQETGLIRPEGLPEDFNVAQIDVSFRTACALNTEGEEWCWSTPTNTPAVRVPMDDPVKFISKAERGSIENCAVTFKGKVDCITQPHENIQAIYDLGSPVISIDSRGDARIHTWEKTIPINVKNVIAVGGSSPNVLLTNEGDLYTYNYADGAAQIIPGAKAEAADCPL